jgi:hypothetical protein
MHFEEATEIWPRLRAGQRGLRRLEARSDSFGEVVYLLDLEMAGSEPPDRIPLAMYRFELLLAMGEEQLAEEALSELLADSPVDLRTMLARVQLTLQQAAWPSLGELFLQLASTLTDERLRARLALARGQLAVRAGESLLSYYREAAEIEPTGAAALLAGAISLPADLAAPWLRAGKSWRAARHSRHPEAAAALLGAATAAAPREPVLLADAARWEELCARPAIAAGYYADLAEVAALPAERRLAARRASRLAAAADPSAAAVALGRLLQEDPASALAAAELEMALTAAGDSDGAIALHRAQCDAAPTRAHSWAQLGERLLAAGRAEEAAEELACALEADVTSPVLDRLFEQACVQAGWEAARVTFAAGRADSVPAYMSAELARWRAARAAERYARQLPSDHAERSSALQRALASWGQFAQTARDRPTGWEACVLLASNAGDPAVEVDVLARAQAAVTSPARAAELALWRARLAWTADDETDRSTAWRAAEAALLDGLHSAHEDPRPVWGLYALYGVQGHWFDAAAVFEERAERVPATLEADRLRYRAAAILMEDATTVRRASELAETVIAAHPDFLGGQELLRASRRRRGEATADLESGERPSLPRSGADPFTAAVRSAEAAEEGGDAAAAQESYKRALEIRAGDVIARDGLARVARARGDAAVLAELARAELAHAEQNGDGPGAADAHEELARIDAELRGDLAPALLEWRAALASHPLRMSALRSLELAYIAAGARVELAEVYGFLAEGLGQAREGQAIVLERARINEQTDATSVAALVDYRRVLDSDPNCRRALFSLENAVRQAGASTELATLQRGVADFFHDHARGRAAFLTRAGETLQRMGDVPDAIQAYRAAVTALPGYRPALAGWQQAALDTERWGELAESAIAEAESAALEQQVPLLLLAAVALMDRAHEGERAAEVLEMALSRDPCHRECFLRLRFLYEELGRVEDLQRVIATRLQVEEDTSFRVALLHDLARLSRDFFDDRDGARRYLREVLDIDPGNRRAVAMLSDISWELGAWSDAAETLFQRARIESDADVLKGIFYRLGTIYADHLDDPHWALTAFQKVLGYDPQDTGALVRVADLGVKVGEWQMALTACERLIKTETAADGKVAHLHRVAHIYLAGFGDRLRAERAYRTAVDLDPTHAGALEALVQFYREGGDHISVRVHLDRVAAAMRTRLEHDIADVAAYQVIARAMAARHRAGLAGSLPVALCAAEIAALLGGAEIERVVSLSAEMPRAALDQVGTPELDDLFFPEAVSRELLTLLRRLADRMAKQLGGDLKRYRVGRQQRLRGRGDPVAAIVHEVAEAMNMAAPEVYVTPADEVICAVEPTQPVSIILGARIANPDRHAELRFFAARSLFAARTAVAVPMAMAVDEFGCFLCALLRAFRGDFAPDGLDLSRVEAERDRVRRLLPSNISDELMPFAVGLTGGDFDYPRMWAAMQKAANRAGLCAAVETAASLAALAELAGYTAFQQSLQDVFVTDLMRFAVSEDHARLRAALGN